MFNKTHHHHHSHETHSSVAITEKRAPTDESVKLLREMESAAEKRILETIRVSDNSFECVIHKQHSPINDQTTYRAIFSLNGTKMTVDYIHDNSKQISNETALLGVHKVVSEKIAENIMKAFMDCEHRRL